MIKELGVCRSAGYFKLNLLNLLEKYPKQKKSSLTLNSFKNYLKSIKGACKKSETEFKLFHQGKIL